MYYAKDRIFKYRYCECIFLVSKCICEIVYSLLNINIGQFILFSVFFMTRPDLDRFEGVATRSSTFYIKLYLKVNLCYV